MPREPRGRQSAFSDYHPTLKEQAQGCAITCFRGPSFSLLLPTSLRSPLPAFALVAIVFGCAGAGPSALSAGLTRQMPGGMESAAPAVDRPTPTRRAPNPVVLMPTVGERAAAIAVKA